MNGRNLDKNQIVHYTRGTTPKRVTSGGVHLCGLAPGLHSSKETSQRWRAIGHTEFVLTGPEIEPRSPALMSLANTQICQSRYF